LAAAPSAEGGLNRPWLKEELRSVGANVRARGIRRCDSEKHKSSIRVVGIRRGEKRDHLPRYFWSMLRHPSLALHDPFHNLAHGHALACYGIAISSLLKRLLHRDLPRAALVGYGEGFFHDDVESGTS
jgi:hypothetical protein